MKKEQIPPWVRTYCTTLYEELGTATTSFLPADLRVLPVRLNFESYGEYNSPFELNESTNEPRLSLVELLEAQPALILLGQAGSGKTYLLHELARELCQQTLAQLQAPGEVRLVLPVYLNLGTIAKELSLKAAHKAGSNFFQSLLQTRLQVANEIFGERVSPVILADNLEALDPALAPLFFQHFSRWFSQVRPEARVIVGCRALSFGLYQPWFKPEQGWQLYGLPGFEWAGIKTRLITNSWSQPALAELEQSGLTQLLTHPAASQLLYPAGWHAPPGPVLGAGLAQLFDEFVRAVFGREVGGPVQLARHSRLLSPEVVDGLALPALTRLEVMLSNQLGPRPSHYSRQAQVSMGSAVSKLDFAEHSVKMGLAERHPVTGALQLVGSFDRLLAVWVCLQVLQSEAQSQLAPLLSHILSKADGESCLPLLYLLAAPPARSMLLDYALEELDEPRRAALVSTLARLDPVFAQTWQAYLERLPRLAFHRFGPALLSLCAALGKRSESASLAEGGLEFLAGLDYQDARLYLELGRVQNHFLAKPQAALASYERAAMTQWPGVEAGLELAGLLSQQGEYEGATEQLNRLRRQLGEAEAATVHTLGLVHLQQQQYAPAIVQFERAVELDEQPQYRYQLALARWGGGEQERAEQEMLSLTQHYPDFADGFYDLGRWQLARNAPGLALANLQRAVELKPQTASYIYDLSRVLVRERRFEEAYIHLHSIAPRLVEYRLALGLVALQLDKALEAQALFENEGAAGLVYLAAVHYRTGDYGTALASLDRARQDDPANSRLVVLSALVRQAAGGLPADAPQADPGLNLPEGLDVEWQLTWELSQARLARLAGQPDLAARHREAAESLQPGHPASLFEAGQVSFVDRRWAEAARYWGDGVVALKERAALPPLSLEGNWLTLFSSAARLEFELYFYYAWALDELGQREQARVIWQGQLHRLSEVAPDSGQRVRWQAAVLYRLGLSLLAGDEPKAALDALALAVSAEPGEALYQLGLARAWQANGQPEQAQQTLEQARQLDPALAEVYARQAQWQLAASPPYEPRLLLGSLNLYLKALELAPGEAEYLHQGALLAYHLGHQNQAHALLERLLETGQYPGEARLLAACNSERGGDLTTALAHIGSPTAQAPAAYRLVAARLARKRGDLAAMEGWLAVAPALDDASSVLQAAFGVEASWLAGVQGHYEVAASGYRRALALYEGLSESARQLRLDEFYLGDAAWNEPSLEASYRVSFAEALYRLGHLEDALEQLDHALLITPLLAKAHLLRGNLLEKQGQAEAALPVLQQAVDLEPNPALSYRLAQLYLARQEYAPAVVALELAGQSREISQQSSYFSQLGEAYQALDNWEAARLVYGRGVQVLPQEPGLHRALAECYIKEDKLMAAVQPLQEVVVLRPEDYQHRERLAGLYEQLGWWQEAASEYEQLTRLRPGDAQGWLRSGLAWLQLDRAEQGRLALLRALSLDEGLAVAHYELGRYYLDSHRAANSWAERVLPDLSGMFTMAEG